jgi:hypothetical protein
MSVPNRTALPPNAQSHVEVQISPTIAADFAERQVFPELLRPTEAVDRISFSHIYCVSIEYAEQVLTDVKARYETRRTLPRGRAKAFSSLIERLEGDIRRALGIWLDPGISEALQRQDAKLSRFSVGDKARLWLSADDTRNGDVVTILEPYGFVKAHHEDGEYVDHESGRRFSYLPAYRVKDADGRRVVWQAGNLQTLDYKPGHLRLVCSEGCNV